MADRSIALSVAVATLMGALLVWMVLQVAEYPGVPREVGDLPLWFGGAPAPVRQGAAPPAGVQTPAGGEAPSANTGAATDEEFVQIAGSRIEIVLTEYAMKPSRIRVQPGTAQFVLRNEGRFAHNFHVEGPGLDVTAEKFSPGRTVRLEVALREGEYKISCPLSNHDQRGMHGALIAGAKGN